MEIFIKRSQNDAEHPLQPQHVTHLRIRVDGPDMAPIDEVFPFGVGGVSTLDGIPQGRDRVITVEGMNGESCCSFSRGRSLPMQVAEGHQQIELYMARIGQFSSVPGEGDLSAARFGHSALLSSVGQLVVVGGAASGDLSQPAGLLASIEIFDPVSARTLSRACAPGSAFCLTHPEAMGASVPVGDEIWMLGGIGYDGVLNAIQRIETTTITVNSGGAVGEARYGAAVFDTAGADCCTGVDQVIAGGRDVEHRPTAVVEIVDAIGNRYRGALPRPVWAAAAAQSRGRGIVFGGLDERNQVADNLFLYDPTTRQFADHVAEVEGRAWAVALGLADGRVLVLGGMTADGEPSAQIDLFDPELELLCPVGMLNRARYLHAAVQLPDGKVLVLGGRIGAGVPDVSAEAELLDLRFVDVGRSCGDIIGQLNPVFVQPLNIPRFGAEAVLLPNGGVAVVGGIDRSRAAVRQIEIFMPE